MKSTAGLNRPLGAVAAMTSSEGPGMITPDQGSGGIREEQDVGVTPTRTRRSESAGLLTPASSPSELGSILTAPDDETRPVTKRDVANAAQVFVRQIRCLKENVRLRVTRRPLSIANHTVHPIARGLFNYGTIRQVASSLDVEKALGEPHRVLFDAFLLSRAEN